MDVQEKSGSDQVPLLEVLSCSREEWFLQVIGVRSVMVPPYEAQGGVWSRNGCRNRWFLTGNDPLEGTDQSTQAAARSRGSPGLPVSNAHPSGPT